MNDSDFASAIAAGSILPLVISVLTQPKMTDAQKALVAFAACFIGAAIAGVVTGAVDVAEPSFSWLTYFGAVYGSAMVTWRQLYKPTGVTTRIEDATDQGGPRTSANTAATDQFAVILAGVARDYGIRPEELLARIPGPRTYHAVGTSPDDEADAIEAFDAYRAGRDA